MSTIRRMVSAVEARLPSSTLLGALLGATMIAQIAGLLLRSTAEPDALLLVTLALLFLPVSVARPDIALGAALLFASSDVFAAVEVGTLTLKATYLLFGLTLVGTLARLVARRWPRPRLPTDARLLVAATAGLLALYVLATIFSSDPLLGVRQLAVITGGALVPAAAVLLVASTIERARGALTWFGVAQLTVATVGLYQFVSSYLPLPGLIPPVSQVGSVVRVSALSFEPAYYAAYAVTGLPLLLVFLIKGRRLLRIPAFLPALVVLAALLLSVSRAGYLALPLIFVGTFLILRGERRIAWRRLLLAAASIGILALGVSAVAGFDAVGFLRERLASIVDPQEPTSNQPRLRLYALTVEVVREHPVLGIGPGNLASGLAEQGFPFPPGAEHAAVANNVWLQAASDAGLGTIPLLLLLAWAIFRLTRSRSPAVASLALGALLFLVVSGAFVSFLWEVKLWSVIALALAVKRFDEGDPVPAERPTPS